MIIPTLSPISSQPTKVRSNMKSEEKMNSLQNELAKSETRLGNINPRFLIPLGALSGLLLGVIARLWMRWISTDPEFSWSGSIFIVLAITIFFTVHSIVYFAIRKSWSRRSLTIVRTVAIIFSLPIFTAAGGIMLPTVFATKLVMRREL